MPTPPSTRRLLAPGRSPHDREIARLAVPAFGALIAEPLYVLTDTAVVGHLGTPQLGGLAVASSVLLTLYAVFIFLAYGTTAAVSRLLGAGDEREAAHQAVQSMWLALLIGVGVTLIGLALSGPLVGLMGATGRSAPTPSSICGSASWACRPCCWCWPAPATCAACRTPARHCWWRSAPRWPTW